MLRFNLFYVLWLINDNIFRKYLSFRRQLKFALINVTSNNLRTITVRSLIFLTIRINLLRKLQK